MHPGYDERRWPEHVRAESERRRRQPLRFFAQLLEDLFRDCTPEETTQLFSTKAEHYPWYAADVLDCLEAIALDPPSDLVALLRDHGWLTLAHEMAADGHEAPYTFDEQVRWLSDLRARFAAIYETHART